MPEPEQTPEAILKGAGCGNKVIAHCRAVRDLALVYADHHPFINRHLVETGALLHDIGRSDTHSLRHAQQGADMVREMRMDEVIARIVERHAGAGLTPDECTLLGLYPRDCMPHTIEEKIVTHADNLISGVRRVSIHERLASALYLPRKIRLRMYRLAMDVELTCQ